MENGEVSWNCGCHQLRGGVLVRVTALLSLSHPHKKAAQVVN